MTIVVVMIRNDSSIHHERSSGKTTFLTTAAATLTTEIPCYVYVHANTLYEPEPPAAVEIASSHLFAYGACTIYSVMNVTGELLQSWKNLANSLCVWLYRVSSEVNGEGVRSFLILSARSPSTILINNSGNNANNGRLSSHSDATTKIFVWCSFIILMVGDSKQFNHVYRPCTLGALEILSLMSPPSVTLGVCSRASYWRIFQ